MNALSVENLSVRLSHARSGPVLEGISLRIAPGECLAVVGESGAGKSVLARTLLGLTQADPDWRVTAESLEIAGTDLTRASQRRWRSIRGSQVGFVLQDALQSLDPLRTIGNEVGEALAIRGSRRSERRARVVDALTAAGLPEPESLLSLRSEQLSGGMRQRALIASAVIASPSLVIADEPTTALDPTVATRVLDLFRELTANGTALLLISHDLHSVASIADRVAVLDSGRIVEVGDTRTLLSSPAHDTTRALVSAIPRGPKPRQHDLPSNAPTIVEFSNVAREFTRPDGGVTGLGTRDAGVSFRLRRGEALGVVGESGAGKTTLARILVGAERVDRGTVTLGPDARARLIPQDPLATFDPRWRVERIINASRASHASPTAAELLDAVGLDDTFLRRRPRTLSGGQRQRVAIARALAAEPDVLVCDEPVSALDVSTQAGILDLFRTLQRERGVAIIFVSHDLAAVRTVCDRVLVLRDGLVIEEGPTEEVFTSPAHPFTRELLRAVSASTAPR